MKAIYYITVFALFLTFSLDAFSQERTRRQRPSEVQAKDNIPGLTERARIKNEVNSQAPNHIVWLREIYRDIDLQKEANAPLLYPTKPIGDRKNLFTLLFRLFLEEKIDVYNYLSDREVFDESEKIDVGEFLDKHQIPKTAQGSGDNVKYVVEDIDIPASEVTSYMVKEGWHFDEATGSFKSRIIALCPVLVRMDYYTGGETKEALFWVTYEDIRPYISREMIMTSNYNNALTYTMDDYFIKGMYDGEIFQTVNLMNQTLAQQLGSDDPDVLKAAQDSIETQLKGFEKQLWIQPDTTKVATEGKKEKKSSSRSQKVDKPKESKSDSSSSAPKRSVRRTR